MARHNTADLTLSDQINISTRKLHTQLNRMITLRLPLALPPHSADPTVYTIGIRQFAQVYFTFESLWHDISQTVTYQGEACDMSEYRSTMCEQGANLSNRPGSYSNKLRFLSRLLPVELERSHRLRRDLSALEKLAASKLDTECFSSIFPITEKFITRIRERVRHKPHVLIAYAWIMYMAIFSGGRWIRAQLLSVGEDFWLAYDSKYGSQVQLEEPQTDMESCLHESIPGLCFLSFNGVDDGESLKASFKERLLDAEHIFSSEERTDIIEEAHEIFRFNIAVVKELDNVILSVKDKHPKNQFLGNIFSNARKFIWQTKSILMRVELQIGIAILVTLGAIIWHMYP